MTRQRLRLPGCALVFSIALILCHTPCQASDMVITSIDAKVQADADGNFSFTATVKNNGSTGSVNAFGDPGPNTENTSATPAAKQLANGEDWTFTVRGKLKDKSKSGKAVFRKRWVNEDGDVVESRHTVRINPEDARQHSYFHFRLNGGQEVPPTGSPATGSGTAVVDVFANTLTYYVAYSGLLASETAAYIEGPAERGSTGSPLANLPLGSPKSGVWAYPESLEVEIVNGLTYVNIRSTTSPGGEIRGQIDGVAVPAAGAWTVALAAGSLLLAGLVSLRRRRRVGAQVRF